MKLPPHSQSPRNHLAGVRTPKESITPAKQDTQGRCTGSRQARHQPTYWAPELSDSSVSHKSSSRNTCRARNRRGFHWPRSTRLPTKQRRLDCEVIPKTYAPIGCGQKTLPPVASLHGSMGLCSRPQLVSPSRGNTVPIPLRLTCRWANWGQSTCEKFAIGN